MKFFFCTLFVLAVVLSAESRIRNRRVKEAPKSCKTMQEDKFLSREDKKVWATVRNSLLIDQSEDDQNITLVQDKGEKKCQWSFNQWQQIMQDHDISKITDFRFFIDEYKNYIYPYVQKSDKSFLVMKIPISTCELTEQGTRAELQLPKCDIPKKKKRTKKRTVAKS